MPSVNALVAIWKVGIPKKKRVTCLLTEKEKNRYNLTVFARIGSFGMMRPVFLVFVFRTSFCLRPY
jgi:hypothetical protein